MSTKAKEIQKKLIQTFNTLKKLEDLSKDMVKFVNQANVELEQRNNELIELMKELEKVSE